VAVPVPARPTIQTVPPFTALAVGPDAPTAYESAVERAAAKSGPLAATDRLVVVPLPEGVDPSKVGTWVQRRAADGSLEDVPEDQHELVDRVVEEYTTPGTCVAVELTGDLAARMRARVGATDATARAWLLFGTTA
jgi:hypothetical protein